MTDKPTSSKIGEEKIGRRQINTKNKEKNQNTDIKMSLNLQRVLKQCYKKCLQVRP